MSATWMTKYGPRRVRHDPPTLEEALFAAEGLTENLQDRINIAAALMQRPVEEVRADAERILRTRVRTVQGRESLGAIVVERRAPRRALPGMPRRSGALQGHK